MTTHSPAQRLSLRRGNGRLRKVNREFLVALDQALPLNAGQGPYWRTEVLSGRAAYPPPTSAGGGPPVAACEQRGDRGRLYPGTYFGIRRGRRVCEDCRCEHVLEQERQWARYCGADAEETPGPAREDGSVSAAAHARIEELGAQIVELKLASEDEEVLRAQIARYQACAGTPS